VRRLPLFVAPLIAVLALASCGSDDDSTSASKPASTPAAPATTPTKKGGCEAVKAPAPKTGATAKKPSKSLDKSKTYTAEFVTSCGDFTVTLDVKNSPKTSASFASLIQQGFYDGLTFHRISPGFVIQGGDPEGNGQGGPGYSVVEAPPSDTEYTRGTVAMAKTGTEEPGTSGSQFFVVTAEDASQAPFSLPPDYAVVGKVTKGLDTVQRIGVIPSDPNTEAPTQPVVIDSVTLTES
jgi:peptidyl-prolyl cis-trans isomerase B (cyclophilin B)